MQLPPIHRLSGRFQDRAQERAFVRANWSGIQLQSALTLIGFSLAWLISLATDVTYLSNSDWFVPVAGSRILSGIFGLISGIWLLRAKLEPGADLAAILVNTWALLSIVTAATVASIYPLVESDAGGISSVLVFTSFWMSIQVLGLGIALAHWNRAIIVTALAYLIIYTRFGTLLVSSPAGAHARDGYSCADGVCVCGHSFRPVSLSGAASPLSDPAL